MCVRGESQALITLSVCKFQELFMTSNDSTSLSCVIVIHEIVPFTTLNHPTLRNNTTSHRLVRTITCIESHPKNS